MLDLADTQKSGDRSMEDVLNNILNDMRIDWKEETADGEDLK